MKSGLAVAVALIGAHLCVAAQRFQASGLAVSVDPPRRVLVISHESIPGYMDAMVMPFHVREANALNGVEPGMKVEFTLVVDNSSSWIEGVRALKFDSAEKDPLQARRLGLIESILSKSKAAALAALNVGEAVPDFTLIDQSRQPVRLSQFSGKVVAINFVYTRCPLPDYCFRLANNFGQLQKRLAARMGRDVMLLTVTFDPVHDQPGVLAKYARIWNANPQWWRFLTGPLAEVQRVCGMFGVAAWQDEGVLTHSLHTVVIDRGGKLAANIEGNQYTVKQLGDLVEAVLGRPR